MDIKRKVKTYVGENLVVVKKHGDPMLKAMRMSKCATCPKFNEKRDECLACGCIVSVKIESETNRDPKVGTMTERFLGGAIIRTYCPLGKWGDKDVANHYRQIKNQPLLK